MGAKKEIKKIGTDFFSGLRFGLGGFPSICQTPGRRIRSKGKGRGLGIGRGISPIGTPYKSKGR